MIAFEITADDVCTVLGSMGLKSMDWDALYKAASSLMDDLDFDAVEAAALYGDDMDEQTEFAHKEIESQLKASAACSELLRAHGGCDAGAF